jgi:hypothetical protein
MSESGHWTRGPRLATLAPAIGAEEGVRGMVQIGSTIRGNFLAIALGLAALCAVLIAVGWGQGAALIAMLLGGITMFYAGVGHPVDVTEED